MAGESIFVDTSVLVAATVEVHPGHEPALHANARARVVRGVVPDQPADLSRAPRRAHAPARVGTRAIVVHEALAALDTWRSQCALLEESAASTARLIDLVGRYDVKGKQIHDANVVAVMLAHGVRRLLTRNPGDFQRYTEIDLAPIHQ